MTSRDRTVFNRRRFLLAEGAASVAPLISGWTKPNQVAVGTPNSMTKPGDYVWDPGLSPVGEVVIIVSIPEQIVHVYRGGVEIGKATCSTGRKGHATPTGGFVVLQKDLNHVSSIYTGGRMPFMERLTWRGVALHAGNLPGYPASHGCIRLPYHFAQLLFGVTHLGVPVIVTDNHSEPTEVVHPTTFLPSAAADEVAQIATKAKAKPLPPKWRNLGTQRPAKVVASIPDHTLIILEDGRVVAKGPATLRNQTRLSGVTCTSCKALIAVVRLCVGRHQASAIPPRKLATRRLQARLSPDCPLMIEQLGSCTS